MEGHMAYYVVSYDQHYNRDYTPVWGALKTWGAQRILESLWLMQTDAMAGQIRDSLRAITKDEDSLVVIELKQGSLWGSFNAQEAGVNWLVNHIRQF
jgi:CRISPR/Cas system-associated endoribonuclease Cas2